MSDLQARIKLSQSALSQHLAVLREAGMVETRRSAQTIFYSLPAGPVHRVMQTLHEIYCGNPNSTEHEPIEDDHGYFPLHPAVPPSAR